jgi:broad specificity polyphosphatase/5'/3'-nucleotidase SurE
LRNNEVDLYNINIPLIEGILSPEGLKVCWTTIWRNSYTRLFKSVSVDDQERSGTALTTTPDPLPIETEGLLFKWAPEMKDLITPPLSSLPAGSDGWAIHQGYVSVTPLRATFGEPPINQGTDIEDRIWKMRL